MLSPLFASIVRTGVPVLVGALVAWLVSLGVDVPADVVAEMVAACTLLVTVAYYAAARLIERRWPSWSWLLGSASIPIAYTDSDRTYPDETAVNHPGGVTVDPAAADIAPPGTLRRIAEIEREERA